MADVMDEHGMPENQEAQPMAEGGAPKAPGGGLGHKESAAPDAELEKLKEEVAQKTALADDCHSRLLRLQADFDNYRKRVQKEREDERRWAAEEFILGILPAMDNMERALAVRGEQEESILTGVEMIHRQIMEFLAKEGVAPVPAVGTAFDPALHEAVAFDEVRDKPDNEVVEELRRGYYLKGKVIRPAMVKVCRNC